MRKKLLGVIAIATIIVCAFFISDNVSFNIEDPADVTADTTDTAVADTTTQAVSQEQTTEPENKPDPGKPMLALTFDDGPSPYTEKLLDTLKKHGAKGTFFIVGSKVQSRENTLKRMVNEGHELANHTYSHQNLTKASESLGTDEINRTRELIKSITGEDCRIVRPPEGAYDEKVAALGRKLDMVFVNWNVDSQDWKSKNESSVYNEIINYVTDGSIILCHDLHETTVNAMERVVPKLIEQGYQLVTVSELLESSSREIKAGNIYYRR